MIRSKDLFAASQRLLVFLRLYQLGQIPVKYAQLAKEVYDPAFGFQKSLFFFTPFAQYLQAPVSMWEQALMYCPITRLGISLHRSTHTSASNLELLVFDVCS